MKKVTVTKRIRLLALCSTTYLLGSCIQQETPKAQTETLNENWKIIYGTDERGQTCFGSKSALMELIRRGYPVRIGWSSRRSNDRTKTVEHFVDVDFLTIANGKEVFAQIRPFMAQRPDLDSDTLSIEQMTIKSHWVLGTNGTINSVNNNLENNVVTTYPHSHFGYPIDWYVNTK